MSNVPFIIINDGNGNEERINLIHSPSNRNIQGKRYVLPDYLSKRFKTFLNGKYFYVSETEQKKKTASQVSRKTETANVSEVTQKKVTKSDLNRIKKNDLIEFILSHTK